MYEVIGVTTTVVAVTMVAIIGLAKGIKLIVDRIRSAYTAAKLKDLKHTALTSMKKQNLGRSERAVLAAIEVDKKREIKSGQETK